jgi:hypothetical protein
MRFIQRVRPMCVIPVLHTDRETTHGDACAVFHCVFRVNGNSFHGGGKKQRAIDCSILSFGTQTAKQELIAVFISLS